MSIPGARVSRVLVTELPAARGAKKKNTRRKNRG
jgi:hypothetical protein